MLRQRRGPLKRALKRQSEALKKRKSRVGAAVRKKNVPKAQRTTLMAASSALVFSAAAGGDVVVVDFPGTPTWWFENPNGKEQPWLKHVLTPVTNNESPQFADVNSDGKLDFLFGFSPDPKKPDGPDRRMAWAIPAADPTAPWQRFAISSPAAADGYPARAGRARGASATWPPRLGCCSCCWRQPSAPRASRDASRRRAALACRREPQGTDVSALLSRARGRQRRSPDGSCYWRPPCLMTASFTPGRVWHFACGLGKPCRAMVGRLPVT